MIKDDPADAHEERNMWNQILTDVKRLKQISAKAADISNQIVELEAAIATIDPETGKSRSASFHQFLASGLLLTLCPHSAFLWIKLQSEPH